MSFCFALLSLSRLCSLSDFLRMMRFVQIFAALSISCAIATPVLDYPQSGGPSSSLQPLQKNYHFHIFMMTIFLALTLNPLFWQMSTDQIHEICKCRRLPDGKVAGPIADTSQARKRTIASIPATLFVCQIVSFGCHLEMKNSKHERKRFCYLPRNFALSHSILFYLFSCTSS